MLEIKHLVKGFQKKEVLKNLNLSIDEGSIFGLVGVNGAGKSTLLRSIAGVYKPDEGEVLFNGLNTYNSPEARKHIAFVSDEVNDPIGSTIDSMKVFYQSMYNFDEDAYQKYLKLFQLDEKSSLNNLSKGNKRRVSLLFALSLRADLILLDEAYDGLEPLTRYRFKQAIVDLVSEKKTTFVIASHSLKELEDICDSFGILADGKMLKQGDLAYAKGQLGRYQVAFEKTYEKKDFNHFDILHFESEGRVIQMVIEGEQGKVKEKLEAMNPLILDVLPVNFEELFIYELEQKEQDNA